MIIVIEIMDKEVEEIKVQVLNAKIAYYANIAHREGSLHPKIRSWGISIRHSFCLIMRLISDIINLTFVSCFEENFYHVRIEVFYGSS
jgi:hypothetical protein